ncbi:hypothetical protein L1987_49681 [Smallanthus sonchifolius]|uniref:Uncharacterized protein n=1 Tax=Smallanthus sonchifolius TaxID=185202 RepID=A0ACB9FWE7_9ASTR|nr:hypothetical protein L1987_49681 [Smallanthus sonchifolius]
MELMDGAFRLLRVTLIVGEIDRGTILIMQVLVIANPANTNALILKEFAPLIPEDNITSLRENGDRFGTEGVTPKMLTFMWDLRKVHELSCPALLRRIGEALDEQERISLTSRKHIGY